MQAPPDGKPIGYIIPDAVDEPVAPDDPLEPVQIDVPDPSEEEQKTDVVSGLADFTSGIMDVINALKGNEELDIEGLRGLIDELRKPRG